MPSVKTELRPALTLALATPLAQLRVVAFRVAGRRALLAVHSQCPSIDPWHRSFFLPTDTLKLTAFEPATGRQMWHVDVEPGMIPGMWYCPVLPFDLDDDGDEEIWLVSNPDTEHPLNYDTFVPVTRAEIHLYAHPHATDTPDARQRYDHPYYASSQRITAMGYNYVNLGGL